MVLLAVVVEVMMIIQSTWTLPKGHLGVAMDVMLLFLAWLFCFAGFTVSCCFLNGFILTRLPNEIIARA